MYNVEYQSTRRGRQQLHIKMCDQHIRGSPFTVVAMRKLEAPTSTIYGLNFPAGVVVNDMALIVTEFSGYCVSIFSPSGEKIKSFGERGSAPSQFLSPQGVTVDRAGNILVVDGGNHHIQKFTSDGNFIASAGCKGDKPCQFNLPIGIGISPNDKVYISVAIDSDDAVYVADYGNHRISLFTSKGYFLRSFGMQGEGPGQFKHPYGVTVDGDGLVYISDRNNMRIQIW